MKKRVPYTVKNIVSYTGKQKIPHKGSKILLIQWRARYSKDKDLSPKEENGPSYSKEHGLLYREEKGLSYREPKDPS